MVVSVIDIEIHIAKAIRFPVLKYSGGTEGSIAVDIPFNAATTAEVISLMQSKARRLYLSMHD